jgi:anthranilate synthase/aminodeoxychorismate synthase-like glutamine amidotransferase
VKILFFDNYDSFTFNLVDYLCRLKVEVVVYNDGITEDDLQAINEFDALVIGPGPNAPEDSTMLNRILKEWTLTNRPMLGVCLGHQAIGEMLGLSLEKANFPMHGKQSLGRHNGQGIFKGIVNPMPVARYHSLILREKEVTTTVEVCMTDEEGQIMAIKHREHPFWGIQFHPESILTPHGLTLLQNWIALCD